MPNLTPQACRAARALLNLTVRDLEGRSGVPFATISKFENGREMRESNRAKLATVFEAAGVEILNGDAPGARLRAVAPPKGSSPAGFTAGQLATLSDLPPDER